MPASELGPWGRIYFRIGVDKAHYSLEALGAFLKVWAALGLVTPRGKLKKRAIVGLIGQPMVDFLLEEGDLVEVEGDSWSLHRWEWYQAPLEGARQRQARHRGQPVDNVTSHDGNVTVTRSSRDVPYSSSLSTSSPEEDLAKPADGGDRDALDRYFELTLSRPWGKRSGAWLAELQRVHGLANVEAALEVEHHDKPGQNDLLSRVAARLERQAERVRSAKAAEPKKADPFITELRDSIADRYYGGPSGSASVVASLNGGSSQEPSDVGNGDPGRPTRGPRGRSPSSPDPAVRPLPGGPPSEPDGQAKEA